jgi:small subunit ribosomal protein S2
MALVTVQELIKAGVHYGSRAKRWHPKMFRYIYMEQKKLHVIDLVQTAYLIKQAYNCVRNASKKGKTILFVGTKPVASSAIVQEATKCGVNYISNRWLGGILTNWKTVRSRIKYLNILDEKEKNGEIDRLPKKEAASLRRKHEKLKYNLGGLRKMEKIPDIVVLVDPNYESTAFSECLKLSVPVISIIDTDCDPTGIHIPIPANDDRSDSIRLILSILSDGIKNK